MNINFKVNIEINLVVANDDSRHKSAVKKIKWNFYFDNFQIKANTSTEFSGLKWESTPKGAALQGKEKHKSTAVISLLDDNNKSFEKNNKKYPQSASEFYQGKILKNIRRCSLE